MGRPAYKTTLVELRAQGVRGYWSILRIIIAAITPRLVAITGRMMFGSTISSRG